MSGEEKTRKQKKSPQTKPNRPFCPKKYKNKSRSNNIYNKQKEKIKMKEKNVKITNQVHETIKVNAIFLDTNILLYNPRCINILIETGNTVIIPSRVIFELDNQKNKSDIGADAREASRIIESFRRENHKSLHIHFGIDFSGKLSSLDKGMSDHRIMAQIYSYYKSNKDNFNKFKLLSNDINFCIVAREVLPDIKIEDYRNDKTDEDELQILIKTINVSSSEIKENKEKGYFYFPITSSDKTKTEERDNIPLNTGVICHSNWKYSETKEWKDNFVAIRKKEEFRVIPQGISAFNTGPYSINNGIDKSHHAFKNEDNFGQAITLAQLLDPKITCMFIQGKPGTGKTLLALAAAIESKKNFRKIVIARPSVPLEDKDTMGFLPGDVQDKLNPWLEPIWMNLDFLARHEKTDKFSQKKHKNIQDHTIDDLEENSSVKKLCLNNKIIIKSLDYIRGQTLERTFIIIDESQNLTPHQIKTIITRVGEGSKIVFTGDLGQIDRYKKLDRYSCGLSYAMSRLNNNFLIAVTNLPDGVRSPLANLADKLL